MFFLFDEGKKDPNTTISGPSLVRQRNAIKWRFASVQMMSLHLMLAWKLCDIQGILTSIENKTYLFVIFQERGPDPMPPSSGSAHGGDQTGWIPRLVIAFVTQMQQNPVS